MSNQLELVSADPESGRERTGLVPRIIVTGGAGFIGSAVVRKMIGDTPAAVLTVDKLTYAGNLRSLEEVSDNPRHRFEQADICDGPNLRRLFREFRPTAVLHLAAESHVDRSIDGPEAFVRTNIVGTYTLLHEALRYWVELSGEERGRFRFVHVSTDEVFGSLGPEGLFTETTPYDPSSPYAATKASADHLARAWYRTYQLPVVTTNCSNNFGPYQFHEKLIPLMIRRAIGGETLPVYGSGSNVRDWLYVDDHAEALLTVLAKGRPGHTYNIGGRNERSNIEVVRMICAILDEVAPHPAIPDRTALIEFVTDRPGHDLRYAIDPSKLETELGWRAATPFESALRETIRWYCEHPDWCDAAEEGAYHGERLGLGGGA
jgi:dTDP-glucose 4,6-dehydratase